MQVRDKRFQAGYFEGLLINVDRVADFNESLRYHTIDWRPNLRVSELQRCKIISCLQGLHFVADLLEVALADQTLVL